MKRFLLATTLAFTSLTCHADDDLDVVVTQADGTPKRLVVSDAVLAAAGSTPSAKPMAADDTASKMEFRTRWLTTNKLHQVLGVGSLLAAVGAGISPKSEDGIHHEFGQAAAALGGLAFLTGVGFHYEDLTWRGGMKDPDNLHALLTTLGAVGYGIAVRDAPKDTHSGAGVAGAVLMFGGIKINW